MMLHRSLTFALITVAATLLLSGALLLLHPRDPALVAVAAQSLLLLLLIGPLRLLRLQSALLPAPPWVRLRRRHPQTALVRPAARWKLLLLRLRAALIDPLPALPRRPEPARSRPVVAKSAPGRTNPRRLRLPFRPPALAIPLPALDIEFVAPGRPSMRQGNDPATHTRLIRLVEATFRATLDPPWPVVLALHDQPRQLTLQCSTSTLLTPAQQRAVIAGLRQRGVVATWSDVASLTARREALHREPSDWPPGSDVLWTPVVTQRQTTIWWPLPRHEHLLLAGNSAAPLIGILQRATDVPLLVHDPDGRLRDQMDAPERLAAQPDALNQARRLQLQHRFACERAATRPERTPPLCLVVAPTESIWPDVQPLLTPDSGVQVVLIPGGLPPIAPLRALCHRLPVIDIAEALTPPLPETFRPAGVPAPRPGQAVAWMRGGSVWWRGRTPDIAAAAEAS